MSLQSDMDLLVDYLEGVPDENNMYNDIGVEKGKTNEYYQGQAEYILQNIDTTEHYFHFVNTVLKDYNKLNAGQKKMIQDRMSIQPVIKDKVVIKEKIVYKTKKPKINSYDDY
jgi:hypothetical protein